MFTISAIFRSWCSPVVENQKCSDFAVLIGFSADLIINIVTCAIFRSRCSPVVEIKKCSDFIEFCCSDSVLC